MKTAAGGSGRVVARGRAATLGALGLASLVDDDDVLALLVAAVLRILLGILRARSDWLINGAESHDPVDADHLLTLLRVHVRVRRGHDSGLRTRVSRIEATRTDLALDVLLVRSRTVALDAF